MKSSKKSAATTKKVAKKVATTKKVAKKVATIKKVAKKAVLQKNEQLIIKDIRLKSLLNGEKTFKSIQNDLNALISKIDKNYELEYFMNENYMPKLCLHILNTIRNQLADIASYIPEHIDFFKKECK